MDTAQRRLFLKSATAGLMLGSTGLSGGHDACGDDASTAGAAAPTETGNTKRRVAVIGHTGRGDYGHGLDTVWQKIPSTTIVAVADANPAGLAKAQKKLSVAKGYTDFRKMLAEVQPEFVSVGPRHADQHHDMAMAAIQAGVKGIYIEKPFCRTPAEADSLVAACDQHGAKIAVAHRNRYHPALKHIEAIIQSGDLGQIIEFRGRGKGDHRGGPEDLWVLGSHVLNLVQHFGGHPKSCSARVFQDGRPVTADDVKPGSEGLGSMAGNQVRARFETEKGITAYYDSFANDGTAAKGFCLQMIGSKGVIMLHIDANPIAHFLPGNPFQRPNGDRPWIPITTAGLGKPETQRDVVAKVHDHILGVEDLIQACDDDRRPLCDARDGLTTVEMICAVFESHRQAGKEISFPLTQRGNAFDSL
ncbi:putative oxidoreductase YvaA [Rubripirellula lacrimiformis]|uniref:Putative oxidoreductase YvaA n=1 Tax=Rubripirellula lacrimiformis TaxID=1930273 RepID=A0A517N544_9BACT|nr:Gfo/Idh/MocA family oxidoreductase [Rubripirellula lacrimiformis]QDT02257.1 putative oxidoreductase YvaA [Rubripirellula lacrimiformis]